MSNWWGVAFAIALTGCTSNNNAQLEARVHELERQVAELRAHAPARSRCSQTLDASVPEATRFELEVAFAPQPANLEPGDAITITSIRGTRADLAPGGEYLVTGTYTLASADEATLGFNVTAIRPGEGCTTSHGRDAQNVKRGSGTFELATRMVYPGNPHVSFYVDGSSHGGQYFTAR